MISPLYRPGAYQCVLVAGNAIHSSFRSGPGLWVSRVVGAARELSFSRSFLPATCRWRDPRQLTPRARRSGAGAPGVGMTRHPKLGAAERQAALSVNFFVPCKLLN
jgi:hypothetical protein